MGETLALNVQMQKKGKKEKRRKPWAPFVWHFYALSPPRFTTLARESSYNNKRQRKTKFSATKLLASSSEKLNIDKVDKMQLQAKSQEMHMQHRCRVQEARQAKKKL